MIFCVRSTEQEKGLDAQDRNDRDGNAVRKTGLDQDRKFSFDILDAFTSRHPELRSLILEKQNLTWKYKSGSYQYI